MFTPFDIDNELRADVRVGSVVSEKERWTSLFVALGELRESLCFGYWIRSGEFNLIKACSPSRAPESHLPSTGREMTEPAGVPEAGRDRAECQDSRPTGVFASYRARRAMFGCMSAARCAMNHVHGLGRLSGLGCCGHEIAVCWCIWLFVSRSRKLEMVPL